MPAAVIRVSQLGKAFRRYPSRWARLKEWLLPFMGIRHTLHWVLQGIDFSVAAGESIGIIGINGAGKSTLLKLITGTLQPTVGSVVLKGRVAALLELGMGFHPDFTGRENVRMAGSLAGLGAAEIEALMPEIEDFAEIGAYIDQPVRMYSSGMQVRLAFSVATAVRPDILIVDEALSVGDAYFQHKSFARIRRFQEQGTSLLLVSHDKHAIQAICHRAIMLNEGVVAIDDRPDVVFDYYNALVADREAKNIAQVAHDDGRIGTVSGNGAVSIAQVALLGEDGIARDCVAVGEKVRLIVTLRTQAPVPALVVGYVIKDRLGQDMYGTNTHHLGCPQAGLEPGMVIRQEFEFIANLGEGSYSVSVAAHGDDTHLENNYEWRDSVLVFEVINQDRIAFTGSVYLEPQCSVTIRKEGHV